MCSYLNLNAACRSILAGDSNTHVKAWLRDLDSCTYMALWLQFAVLLALELIGGKLSNPPFSASSDPCEQTLPMKASFINDESLPEIHTVIAAASKSCPRALLFHISSTDLE